MSDDRLKPAPTEIPNSSYEWFARAKVPRSYLVQRGLPLDADLTIGLAPLDEAFKSGVVEFKVGDVIHDVGAGSGRSTEKIINEIPWTVWPNVHLIVSDPSPEQREELSKRIPKHTLVIGADALMAISATSNVNKLFFINAVHMLPPAQRQRAFGLAYESLAPGGQFIMSTAFCEGDVPEEEAKQLMGPWMNLVLRSMTPEEREIVKKSKEKGVARMVKWLPQQYFDELTGAGLEVEYFEPDILMPITREGYEGICHYVPWNQDIIPVHDDFRDKFSVDRQIELTTTAFRTVWLDRLGRDEESMSRRNTLVVVARKPLAAAG